MASGCIAFAVRANLWATGQKQSRFCPQILFEVCEEVLEPASVLGLCLRIFSHMVSKLTDIQIRNAQPRPKPYKLGAGRGLTLVVMPDGAKYWRFRYRFGGKEKWLSVGRPYPETTLKEADLKTTKLRVQLANDTDPAEERLGARVALRESVANTFGAAAEAWFEFRSKVWSPRTSAQVREYLDKDLLPALSKRPVGNITTRELATLSSDIESRGAPDVAKKVRQWLASIYGYARANGWTTVDPVHDLRAVVLPSPGPSHYAHLAIDELPELLRKLDAISASPIVKACAMMAIWTANRPGITRTLKWSELDLDEALWIIEKGREGMKLGYSHVTPLPHQAVARLRDIRRLTGTFEHVFPGRNDPRQAISDGAVNGLLKRLGYRGKQTTHGFRHLISTALNERGYESDWVERQLAHGDPDKIRSTYNKAVYLEPRRKMMQDWADLLDAMRDGKAGLAVPLRKAS
jgi:integrase